jgi:hypothetical protein
MREKHCDFRLSCPCSEVACVRSKAKTAQRHSIIQKDSRASTAYQTKDGGRHALVSKSAQERERHVRNLGWGGGPTVGGVGGGVAPREGPVSRAEHRARAVDDVLADAGLVGLLREDFGRDVDRGREAPRLELVEGELLAHGRARLAFRAPRALLRFRGVRVAAVGEKRGAVTEKGGRFGRWVSSKR